MRTLKRIGWCMLLVPGVLWGQPSEVESLRAELAALQAQVAAQQATIARLQAAVEALTAPPASPPLGAAPLAAAPVVPPPAPSAPPASAWDLDFYGYVKLDASYDTQRTSAGDLAYYLLPETGGQSDDEFNLTAKETRLGFWAKAPPVHEAKLLGRVEMDFYGSASEENPNPRLRLAYVQIDYARWTLIFGQDYDVWNTTLPTTVNFALFGNHGALWSRRPQVKAIYTLPLAQGKLLFKGAAARTIGNDLDKNGQEDGKDAGFPTLEGAVEWWYPLAAGRDLVLALGGHWGQEALDLSGVDSHDFDTHLLQFSWIVPFHSRIRWNGALWTGTNLSNFRGGIGQGINLERLRAIDVSGGWTQFQFQLNPAWLWLMGVGVDDPDDDDLSPGQRSRNRHLTTSLRWNVWPELTWALEWMHLETDYLQADGSAQTSEGERYQSAVIYKF